jgi:predicted DNA-binding transcriptional regulator AlpA
MKTEELSLVDPMEIPEERIIPMIAHLAALQTALTARLLARDPDQTHSDDRLLTVEEAAAKLQTSKDWIYRKCSDLPFVVRVGKCLRFSEMGIDLWVQEQTRKDLE